MNSQLYIYGSSLYHYGIKGQKWGERRFQNPDGTLTPIGRQRYAQYEKDFGKKTADRLMKDIKKGKTEKQAFDREYTRRKNNAMYVPVGSVVVGGVAGRVIGAVGANALTNRKSNLTRVGTVAGLNVLAPRKTYDSDIGSAAGSLIGTVLGTSGGIAVAHLANGYKLGDLSQKGLIDFLHKTKEYQKTLQELKREK